MYNCHNCHKKVNYWWCLKTPGFKNSKNIEFIINLIYDLSPLNLLANAISFGIIVTLFA